MQVIIKQGMLKTVPPKSMIKIPDKNSDYVDNYHFIIFNGSTSVSPDYVNLDSLKGVIHQTGGAA